MGGHCRGDQVFFFTIAYTEIISKQKLPIIYLKYFERSNGVIMELNCRSLSLLVEKYQKTNGKTATNANSRY